MMKVNQDMYARAMRMLLDDPITAHELAADTGMHLITAQELMRTFKKHKVVHVCDWEKDRLGRDTTPVYQLGKGKDKPRHKFTTAERTARYRAKKMMQATMLGAMKHDKPTEHSDHVALRPEHVHVQHRHGATDHQCV